MPDKSDFRKFYRDAHGSDLLTEREKILIGLSVAITRNCQPWVNHRLADARKNKISEETLDSTFNVVSAVIGGIAQSMNQRFKKSQKLSDDKQTT